MAGQPRKHHYVPQFYLAGFTKNDCKVGDLYVLDKEQRKTWKSTPKGSAHKRDFYAIEPAPGGDPMAVEKKMAQVEGQWSAALADVIEKKALPDDKSFGDLMMFVAFMAVRVVRIRDILSNFIDQVSKAEIELMLSTKEGQEHFRKTLAELGHEMSDDEFEQMVSLGQSDDYEVNFEQTWELTLKRPLPSISKAWDASLRAKEPPHNGRRPSIRLNPSVKNPCPKVQTRSLRRRGCESGPLDSCDALCQWK